jgi:hypothetical protein
MKHTIVEQVTIKETKIVKITCDRCHTELPWKAYYDINDMIIRREIGKDYPEGRFTEVWKIEDLCDGCIDFLKTLLVCAGYTITDGDEEII